MKLKDYSGAIQSAEKSSELAREAKAMDMVKQNDKLIQEAKAGK